MLQEEPPADAPEPLIPPPEVIAELEEKMLRQWIDDSIPATRSTRIIWSG